MDVLLDLENEYFENIGPEDMNIDPPFLVDCIEVYVDSKTARNFLPNMIDNPLDDLPF